MRIKWLALGLGLLLISTAFDVPARQPGGFDPHQWMLEISQAKQAPDYESLPEVPGENYAVNYSSKLDDERGTNRNPHAGLEIQYWIQGEAIRAKVWLSWSPVSSRKWTALGDYLMRPGEAVRVTRLPRYGFIPFQLKIVSAKALGAAPPEVVNETPSLVVQGVDQDRAQYLLTVHNISPNAVDAFVASVFDGAGRCRLHSLGTWSGHFISPATVTNIKLEFPVPGEDDEGVVGAGGNSCFNSPQDAAGMPLADASSIVRTPKIVIEAAEFSDGSYEGNDREVAMLAARRLGRRIEKPKIAALVEDGINHGQPDGLDKLNSVLMQVKALKVDVDSVALDSLKARFQGLPVPARQALGRDMRNGELLEKGTFLTMLRAYLIQLPSKPEVSPSLKQWWESTRGRCNFFQQQSCSETE